MFPTWIHAGRNKATEIRFRDGGFLTEARNPILFELEVVNLPWN